MKHELNYCYCCGAPQKGVLLTIAFTNGNGVKPTPTPATPPKAKRGRPRNLTPEEIAKIKALREQGKTREQVALETDRSVSTIDRAIKL